MSVPSNGRGVSRPQGGIMADGGVYVGNGMWIFSLTATPSDGTSGTGAGVTGPGSLCLKNDGEMYTNTGTKASPTWTNQT